MQFDTGVRLELQPGPVREAAMALVEASLSPEGTSAAMSSAGAGSGQWARWSRNSAAGSPTPSSLPVGAVLEAVIDDAYTDFAAATHGTAEHIEDPRERLRVGAEAYLRFARDHPATYRILFSRHRPSALPSVGARAAANHHRTVEAIASCAGRPAHADAGIVGILWWAARHGSADLPPAHPPFPRPAPETLVEEFLRRIVLHESSATSERS